MEHPNSFGWVDYSLHSLSWQQYYKTFQERRISLLMSYPLISYLKKMKSRKQSMELTYMVCLLREQDGMHRK